MSFNNEKNNETILINSKYDSKNNNNKQNRLNLTNSTLNSNFLSNSNLDDSSIEIKYENLSNLEDEESYLSNDINMNETEEKSLSIENKLTNNRIYNKSDYVFNKKFRFNISSTKLIEDKK